MCGKLTVKCYYCVTSLTCIILYDCMNKKQKHVTQTFVDSQRYVTLDFGPMNQFKDMHCTSKGFVLFGLSFIRMCGSTIFFNYIGDGDLQFLFSKMVVLLSFATINCTSDLTLISTDTESYQ